MCMCISGGGAFFSMRTRGREKNFNVHMQGGGGLFMCMRGLLCECALRVGAFSFVRMGEGDSRGCHVHERVIMCMCIGVFMCMWFYNRQVVDLQILLFALEL